MGMVMKEDPDKRIWQRQQHRRQLDSLSKWFHIYPPALKTVCHIINCLVPHLHYFNLLGYFGLDSTSKSKIVKQYITLSHSKYQINSWMITKCLVLDEDFCILWISSTNIKQVYSCIPASSQHQCHIRISSRWKPFIAK